MMMPRRLGSSTLVPMVRRHSLVKWLWLVAVFWSLHAFEGNGNGISLVAAEQNHYSILGLSRRASTDDVRRAYKKLAKKYHPDRNKGNPDAQAQFVKVAEAHEVLTDDRKRRQYDQTGYTDSRQSRYQNNQRSSQSRRQGRGGYYTYQRRNGRTYYQFHATHEPYGRGGGSNEEDFAAQITSLVFLMLVAMFFLATWNQLEPDDDHEGSSSSPRRNNQEQQHTEKKSTPVFGPISTMARTLTRLNSEHVQTYDRSKPFVVVMLLRVQYPGEGEAVGLSTESEQGLQRLLHAYQLAMMKFRTDPIRFRFVTPTRTSDSLEYVGGELKGRLGTRSYLQILQTVIRDEHKRHVSSPAQLADATILELGESGTLTEEGAVVVVDSIFVANFPKPKCRVFLPSGKSGDSFPKTASQAASIVESSLDNWLLRLLEGQMPLKKITEDVEVDSQFWPNPPT